MGLMDIKIRRRSNGKFDLDLSSLGRFKTVTGSDKLAEQVIRSVVNSIVFKKLINSPQGFVSGSIINNQLQSLRSNQFLMTYEVPETLEGYKLLISEDGVNFKYVSETLIFKDYTISRLENEKDYWISYTIVEEGIEGNRVPPVKVRPTADISRQRIYHTGQAIIFESNKQIEIKFLYKRMFSPSEIIKDIKSIQIIEGTPEEPRKLFVKITITNFAGSFSDLLLSFGG